MILETLLLLLTHVNVQRAGNSNYYSSVVISCRHLQLQTYKNLHNFVISKLRVECTLSFRSI